MASAAEVEAGRHLEAYVFPTGMDWSCPIDRRRDVDDAFESWSEGGDGVMQAHEQWCPSHMGRAHEESKGIQVWYTFALLIESLQPCRTLSDADSVCPATNSKISGCTIYEVSCAERPTAKLEHSMTACSFRPDRPAVISREKTNK